MNEWQMNLLNGNLDRGAGKADARNFVTRSA
jgi:hypothetical protein